MSNSSPRRSRPRALGLLSAGVLVLGAAAAAPVAQAADGTGSAGSSAGAAGTTATARPGGFTAGRYVVLLREAPAAAYDGGTARLAATRPTGDQQFRPDSGRVQAYRDHLVQQQTRLAREVGATPTTRYTIASNGFVADLTADQALELAGDRRVLLVEKDVARRTDKAPDATSASLLGLDGSKGTWKKFAGGRVKAGAGVVIGDIDSGYWPESRSFRGSPLTETPQTTWDITMDADGRTRMEKVDGGVFTGACETGEGFETPLCNTKVVGARYYPEAFLDSVPEEDISETEFISTRDGDGHGSHTASTAAGAVVRDVEVEGRQFGRLSGMAPGAKLAIYKVCWEDTDPDTGGCYNSAILAAIDDAIADGVDAINFSISGALDTVVDSVEVAFEGAAEAGIFVAASAGNDGPDASTVAHNSPWLTTVASTTYTTFENTVVLGNGEKYAGASIAGEPVPSSPLVDSAAVVAPGGDPEDAALCGPDTLDPAQVQGTIVVCTRGVYDRVAKSAEVKRAGGVAMILANPSENSLDADFHSVPTVHVPVTSGEAIEAYIAEAGPDATAKLVLGNRTDQTTAVPQVSGFSSRGPGLASDSDILKPDIAAPGSSVLAAVAPPTNSDRDYDLYSGTSMAAPHITGLAALIMGVHPTWTPQMVQSAMMTTAKDVFGEDGAASTDGFAQGAGLVNPRKFFNPGWFISSTPRQWRGFLTGQGLDTGEPAVAASDVNLPSMAKGQVAGSATFTRSLVSTTTGTWSVSASVPGFDVQVPATLTADRVRDVEELTATFTRTTAPLGEFAQGHITLTGPTTLRIPVALRPVSVAAPLAVEGTGTDGSVTVPITPAETGVLEVGTQGLAKADSTEASVAEGDSVLSDCIEVPEGVDLARFDLDAADDTSDLDLFVYVAESCDPSTIYDYAGQSATGSADERVDVVAPPAGAYFYEVDGFAAGEAGSPIDFRMDVYQLGADGAGDLTVTPNPVPTVAQQETSFDVSWTGLDPESRYLGLLTYEGALAPTVLTVDTTS